ncbi:MAG: RpoL/Rpb11 RNA polymerase subunit family protein [Candidatus Methanofastidiosia archaeon]
MEIISEDKSMMEIVLVGEDHTFANLLRSFLQQDKHVVFAAYRISHPLTDANRPVLKVETDGKKSPRQALADANTAILSHLEKMKKVI